MARVILHTDSGMPYVPSNFIPDNGLAGLVGSLHYNGHDAEVVDRNTLDNFGLLVPEKYRKPLENVYNSLTTIFSKDNPGKGDMARAFPYLAKLWMLDKQLSGHRKKLSKKQGAELAERVIKEDIDAVGFKYFLGSLESTLPACREIKKQKPKTIIVAGGPVVDIAKESPPAIFKANPYIDVAVFGEGEETIVDIADYVAAGKQLMGIPNTIYRNGTDFKIGEKRFVSNLDSLPYPLYNGQLDGQFNIKVFEMNRGCYGECPFCIHTDKSGSVRRTKSTDRIMNEIERLIADGTSSFMEGSSNPSIKKAYDVAKEINRRGLDIRYVMFGSALEFNDKWIKEMARSGLSSIFFGFESGDPEALARIMRKGGTKEYAAFLQKLENAVKATREAGVYPVGSLIYPLPFETEKSAKKTFDAAVKIFKDGGSVPANFAGLYPSSEWGRDPKTHGFIVKDKNYPHGYIMRNLGYKIMTLFPPPLFWQDPGYGYHYFGDYHSFKDYAKETGRFRRNLSKEGITVGASHDTIFIGQLYDEHMPPRDFINMIQRILFTGNIEKLDDVIAKVNQEVTNA
jgi:radical SAM superfamily enzyme YgiQ (UPF0313 family)